MLKYVSQQTARVGGATSTQDAAFVMPFKLPVIPAGQVVTSASLNINLITIANSPEGNVDLYGIPFRASNIALYSEFHTVGTFIANVLSALLFWQAIHKHFKE